MPNPYKDYGYAIKAVWGTSEIYDELHFADREVARTVANRGERILIYETAYKPDGSSCIFGVGKVAGRQFVHKTFAVDDKHFDYAVPFEVDFQFPMGDRHRGIRFDEIATIGELGSAPVLYQAGGIDFIDGLAWKRIYEELKGRYDAHCQGARP